MCDHTDVLIFSLSRLALQVWKALLDATEKVSKARTTASETLSSQVAEIIKMQKNTRAQTLKKVRKSS